MDTQETTFGNLDALCQGAPFYEGPESVIYRIPISDGTHRMVKSAGSSSDVRYRVRRESQQTEIDFLQRTRSSFFDDLLCHTIVDGKIVMPDLEELGFKHGIARVIPSLSVEEQRALFMDAGEAATRLWYVASMSKIVPRDVGNPDKGFWFKKNPEGGYDIKLTDFGHFCQIESNIDAHVSGIKKHLLINPENEPSLFMLFPFISFDAVGRIRVQDDILQNYKDTEDRSLAYILNQINQERYEEITNRYGKSMLDLWSYFLGLQNDLSITSTVAISL